MGPKKWFSSQEKISIIGLAVAASIAIWFGWSQFWFLTDDAHIGFRYISNSLLGHGYVWNPPPFRPVEGYTSFLWIVLLDFIWRVWGVQPPDSANYVSLLFAYLTLLVGAVVLFRMKLSKQLRGHRVLLLALIFIGVLTNRTFLAWTSSGLETAMFNFFLISWLACVLFLQAYSPLWLLGITSTTVLIYLSRPDGLLTTIATIGLVGIAFYVKGKRKTLSLGDVIAVAPLLVLPVHLFWRRAIYGKWLPNTYYAKNPPDGFWTQSGSGYRYLLSFIIEYALWFWLALFLLLLGYLLILWVKHTRFNIARMPLFRFGVEQLIFEPERSIDKLSYAYSRSRLPIILYPGFLAIIGFAFLWLGITHWGVLFIGTAVVTIILLGPMRLTLVEAVVTITLLVHIYYYTVFVGGDHFEFRVYSHLILLGFVSFVWILSKLQIRIRLSVALFTLFILLSWPIPWLHWNQSRNITTRPDTLHMKISVADAAEMYSPLPLPNILVDYLRFYDELQFWLIDRSVGMRHQEHKVFHEFMSAKMPNRDDGLRFSPDGYPILFEGSVGVVAWSLSHINIIDALGLNDSIISQNPDYVRGTRQMAHDRIPPAGYLDCFQPNVFLDDNDVRIYPRSQPFSANKIIECEERYSVHGGYPIDKPNRRYAVEYKVDYDILLDEVHIAETELKPSKPIYLRLFWTPESITNFGYDLYFDLINVNDGSSIRLARSFGIHTERFSNREQQSSGTLTSHILRTPHDLSAGAYLLTINASRQDGSQPAVVNSMLEPISNIVIGPIALGELTEEKLNPQYLIEADFANGIKLDGYDITRESDQLSVLLHWHATKNIAQGYTVFVHLIDKQNNLIAQSDAPPYLPTDLWVSGVQLHDRHVIAIPSDYLQTDAESELHEIRVGLYPSSLVRVPVSAPECFDTSADALLIGMASFNTNQMPGELSCNDVPIANLANEQ